MKDYKSIHLIVDFEIDDKVLTVVNGYLSKQPEPRPYIEPNLAGYVFYFHTLDVKLLKKNVQALIGQDLFSS
ncbi:MAG: site-specific DNA-methyltransferase, partial [Anaerolineaceae bacterium]|nr:site-specific DNA-methyltransferase [Anaerolineaceae bacterium]